MKKLKKILFFAIIISFSMATSTVFGQNKTASQTVTKLTLPEGRCSYIIGAKTDYEAEVKAFFAKNHISNSVANELNISKINYVDVGGNETGWTTLTADNVVRLEKFCESSKGRIEDLLIYTHNNEYGGTWTTEILAFYDIAGNYKSYTLIGTVLFHEYGVQVEVKSTTYKDILHIEYNNGEGFVDAFYLTPQLTWKGTKALNAWAKSCYEPKILSDETKTQAASQTSVKNVSQAHTSTQNVSQTPAEPTEADIFADSYDKKFTPETKSQRTNLTLKEIALGKKYIRLKLAYIANTTDCFFLYRPYDKRGFRIEGNGKTYYMAAQQGMKYQDNGRNCLNVGETLTFYLYFEALPESTKSFNLIEDEGVWVINNIEFKNKKKSFLGKMSEAIDKGSEALDNGLKKVDEVLQ